MKLTASMGSARRRSNVKAPETAISGPLWENAGSSGEHHEPALSLYNLFFSVSKVASRKRTATHMRSFPRVFLAACFLLGTLSGWAQEKKSSPELIVAAAADLSSALQEIGDSYEKKTGVKVKLSFGASGALAQQIQNGAPFDLFFSADMDYPRQLIAAGVADGPSLYQYAVGRLVLWVPTDSPLDV